MGVRQAQTRQSYRSVPRTLLHMGLKKKLTLEEKSEATAASWVDSLVEKSVLDSFPTCFSGVSDVFFSLSRLFFAIFEVCPLGVGLNFAVKF